MIDQLHAAIKALLREDAQFVTALQALGLGRNGGPATPVVLKSFRPLKSLGVEHLPAWVLEPGDDTSVEESIGSIRQVFDTEILLALVWHQQDFDTAFDQRTALLALLVDLFLRNPRPGDIADVRVDSSASDRNANHPTHITTFRLLAYVDVTR